MYYIILSNPYLYWYSIKEQKVEENTKEQEDCLVLQIKRISPISIFSLMLLYN